MFLILINQLFASVFRLNLVLIFLLRFKDYFLFFICRLNWLFVRSAVLNAIEKWFIVALLLLISDISAAIASTIQIFGFLNNAFVLILLLNGWTIPPMLSIPLLDSTIQLNQVLLLAWAAKELLCNHLTAANILLEIKGFFVLLANWAALGDHVMHAAEPMDVPPDIIG